MVGKMIEILQTTAMDGDGAEVARTRITVLNDCLRDVV